MNEPDLAIIQDHLRKSLLDYAASCGARPNWIQEIENTHFSVVSGSDKLLWYSGTL